MCKVEIAFSTICATVEKWVIIGNSKERRLAIFLLPNFGESIAENL